MADYILTLKNEKAVLYHRLSVFFITANVVFLVYLAFFAAYKTIQTLSIVVLAVLCILFLVKLYFKRVRRQFSMRAGFLLIALAWLIAKVYGMAALVLLLDFLHAKATNKKIVKVSEAYILFPSWIKKNITGPGLTMLYSKMACLPLIVRIIKSFST